MNKKVLLIFSLFALLTSCGGNQISNSVSEKSNDSQESIASEESIISEAPSSEEKIEYKEGSFFPYEELYLSTNETYDLSKMISSKYNYSNLIINADGNTISVDEKGIISPLSIGDTALSITFNGYRQIVDVHVTDYEEYGSYFISSDLGRFYGKKAIFFGDSITHNWFKYTHDMEEISGYDGKAYSGYLGYLNDKCKFSTLVDEACSGGTMSTLITEDRPIRKSFDYNVEANKDAIASSDYVFVWYGANDYYEQAVISTSTSDFATSSEEKSTFVGAMRYGISKIRAYNPQAQIIFLNVYYHTYTPKGTTYKISDYNDAIYKVCREYMCKMIDMYPLFTASSFPSNSDDGLHPNKEGQKLICDYILKDGKK